MAKSTFIYILNPIIVKFCQKSRIFFIGDEIYVTIGRKGAKKGLAGHRRCHQTPARETIGSRSGNKPDFSQKE